MKKRIWLFVRLGLGIAVLAFLLRRVDLRQISIRWDLLAALGFIGTLSLLVSIQALSALRWRVLLGPDAPSFWFLWRLYAVGAFFSLFLPTSVGGDAARAVAAAQAMPRTGSAVLSVILERALGVFALVLYAVVGVALMPDTVAPLLEATHLKASPTKLVIAALLLVVVGGAGFLLAMRRPKIRAAMRDGADLLNQLRRAPGRLAVAVLLGLVVQMGYIVAWLCLARGLRLDIPAMFFLVAVPAVSLAAMLPVTFAGIGVREGAWVILLAKFGIASVNAVAYSLVYFLAVILLGLGGGIVFVLRGTAPAPGQLAPMSEPLREGA